MTDEDRCVPARRNWSALRERLLEIGPLWVGGVATVLLFLFAVQLLGTATEAAEPAIERILRRIVVDDTSALGLGWVASYGLTNGSVVAALSLSLLRSGLVSPSETYFMIAGTRLGGTAVIVLVGAMDYLQNRRNQSLTEGTSLGLLTFVITFSIYIPVTALGAVVLTRHQSTVFEATTGLGLSIRSLAYLEPVTDAITRALGPTITLGVAIALLFGSLWFFDSLLERVHTETVRKYVFRHFKRRWMAFGIGLLITGLTTSVAFSLGVIVPLYNRRFVRRGEMVPYILGANIGTLFDTLVVGFVLETMVGVAIVGLVMGLATFLTVLALVGYTPYLRFVDVSQDKLLEDRRFFVAFGGILIVLPIVLLAIPHL
ncbi:MAG: sodium:phosphate symporter [Halobacteriota archaeon]